MVSLNFPTLSLKGRTRQNTRKWPFKSSQAKKNSWVLSTFAHVSRHPEGRKKQNNKWDHTVMRCAYGVYVYKLTIPYIIYMTEWRMRKAYMVYIYICMINNIREQRVCFVCVCVFKLYSVNIKQHSWYILLPCQEPVLSYPLLCFYAPKPAVDPQRIQTDIQSPCITWSLVTKPKPVLNRIVNSTPQAIHLNRFIERGIATWESINLSMFVRIFLHIPHKLHWFLQL